MPAEADAVEIRVLGCLIEKQRTTPDAYPLTLNSLRLACNQSTNRDPVVEYDEDMIRAALERLGRRGWTRLASWSNRRAMKYRHMLDEALDLTPPQMAVLCLLMLRGPQTSGELNGRSDRLYHFDGPADVEATLEELIGREQVARLSRRPGERGQRFAQLLGGDGAEERAAPFAPPVAAVAPAPVAEAPIAEAPAPVEAPPPAPADGALEERVARLEEELGALRDDVRLLREQLGG
jgi:uncharacterized protein YceH (UPF0502 family)